MGQLKKKVGRFMQAHFVGLPTVGHGGLSESTNSGGGMAVPSRCLWSLVGSHPRLY